MIVSPQPLAILIELRDANKSQTDGTERAVGQLGRFLRTAKFPRLTKPNLFLASADDADGHVLAILKGVLAEFDSKVTVFDWQRSWPPCRWGSTLVSGSRWNMSCDSA